MAELLPRPAGNYSLSQEDYNPYGFKYQTGQPGLAQFNYTQNAAMSPTIVKPQAIQSPAVIGKNYIGGTKGNYISSDATNDYTSTDVPGNYDIDPITGWQALQMSAKPLGDIANIAIQKRLIEKQHQAQMNRKLAPYQAVQTTIHGVRDLPAEVLAQQERAAAMIRSQYAGSDPTMDLVSKQMAADKRADIRAQSAAMRGQHLIDEHRRVEDKQDANALRAGEIANRNIDRINELSDFKMSADVNRFGQLRNLSANVFNDIKDNIEARSIYNTQKELVERQNKLMTKSSNLNYYQNEKESLRSRGELDPATEADLNKKIKDLAAERDALALKKLPSFDYTRKNWLSFSRGGKLVPR